MGFKVEFIEKDSEVHTMGDPAVEKSAPWGLARISHRDPLSFGTFNKYLYAADAGDAVDVYVIDTGTNTDHVDFEGRAHWGKTIPENDEDLDGNGHGTHCSGTIAGKKYGVAKKANVYAVKVLRSNGSGTMSDVVMGVEWAAKAHSKKVEAAKKGKGKAFKGSVANMSLGGGKSRTLDLAVNAAVDAGIHFAVAAGNDNADACSYSPASAEKAVTVGASTLADERAYFSNFGKCTDIFAPGLNILSTWVGSKYAVNTISGTSMASPHIAGLLAYLLSLQPSKESSFALPEITPKKLKEDLIRIATRGTLTDMPEDTPNVSSFSAPDTQRERLTDSISSLPGMAVALLTTLISLPRALTRSLMIPPAVASLIRPRSSFPTNLVRSTARSRTLLARKSRACPWREMDWGVESRPWRRFALFRNCWICFGLEEDTDASHRLLATVIATVVYMSTTIFLGTDLECV